MEDEIQDTPEGGKRMSDNIWRTRQEILLREGRGCQRVYGGRDTPEGGKRMSENL